MREIADRTCSGLKNSSPLTVAVICLLLLGTALAAPSITLSKETGPPTSKILVSGSGFAPNVGVNIYFDRADEALVVTNNQGEFHGVTIHAPRSAHPGKHWVTARERNNDKGDQEPFLVRTEWPQFGFTPSGDRYDHFENVLDPTNVGSVGMFFKTHIAYDVLCAPAVAHGSLYFGSSAGSIFRLDAGTGALLWQFDTGNQYSIYSSPAVIGSVVYVGSYDSNLYALDAWTGKLLWKFSTGGSVDSSPAVVDGVVYFGSGDNNVYAVSAASGTPLWTYATGNAVSSSPVVANGVVYVGSFDNNIYALDAATGSLRWVYTTGSIVYSAPAVDNGVVYVVSTSDGLYALNASSGAFLWRYPMESEYSSPAVAYGLVYVGSNDENVYALDAVTGSLHWKYETGWVVYSSPAVANGVVYAGSYDHNMYALNAKTGAPLWKYTTGEVIFASPTVANGMIYFASEDANFYAFGLDHKGAGAASPSASRPDPSTLHPDLKFHLSPPHRAPVAVLSRAGPRFFRVSRSRSTGFRKHGGFRCQDLAFSASE